MARVIQCIADNVVSPLGLTSVENYRNVKAGKSGLARYEQMGNVSSPFMLSRIDRSVIDTLCAELGIPTGDYTFFEKMLLSSSVQAVGNQALMHHQTGCCLSFPLPRETWPCLIHA